MAGGALRTWVLIASTLIMATAGATAGSWYGGRASSPLPTDTQAVELAAELLPGVDPTGETQRRDYGYGFALGDDDFGPGFVEVSYAPTGQGQNQGTAVDTDCAYSRRALTNALLRGWRNLHRTVAGPCEEWTAERGDVAVVSSTDGFASSLTFHRAAPAGLGLATLAGALLGAAAGALAAALLTRRARPLLILVVTLAVIGLLPGMVFGATGMVLNARQSPALPFWTVWPSLLFVLVPLWLFLAVLGGFSWLGGRARPAPTGG
ncbi:hypothetical protein AB0H83_46965 [Dactylosporangium sp. NPDC050688]|uniref:hypothetical protein n=1 Tax=Dactylosporangium sp. NPDC050688 TaxID=3157217 RepID=UPI0033E5EE07